ncbi:hypothetical protein ACLB2K_054985 [Fragaria x ananassa]
MASTLLIVLNYWLAMKEKRQQSPVVSEYWKHLWKLKVPLKMSHFLWRCSMSFYCVCGLYTSDETPLHATWSCSLCVAVLKRVSMLVNFADFFDYAMGVLFVDEMKLLVIILLKFLVIFQQCVLIWESLLAAQVRGQSISRFVVQQPCTIWRPPSPSTVKLNCDAVVFNDGINVGVGMVIRNNYGDLILAKRERLTGMFKPCIAELWAVILGLESVVEGGWQVEVVESDCLEVVLMVNGDGECFVEEGVLVEKVKELLCCVWSYKVCSCFKEL